MLKIFDFFNILQFKNKNKKIKLDFDKTILKALKGENAKQNR